MQRNAALAATVEDRREQIRISLDYFAELARQGALVDREEAW